MQAAELDLFDRGIRRATETGGGEALDAALTELGWEDALATDRRVAVSLLFEYQGAANVTSSALERLLVAVLELDDEMRPAVLLPPLRTRLAPGRLIGDRCAIRGLASAGIERRDVACVVAQVDHGHAAIEVPTSALALKRVSGVDPGLGLIEVTGDIALASTGSRAPVDWTATVSLGQLALSHELVGTARAMLDLARTHALERIQFGRPIGSFQAVRHRLADSLVAIEAAAAVLAAAWDDPSPVIAAMAKSSAGRGGRTVARHCQQVLAGIGFTVSHPFQRYLRRAILLDQLFGAGSVLTAELGADVLRSATLPPTLEL